MLVLVVGYDARRRKSATPRVIYCGRDAEAAKAVHHNPPKGIALTEFVRNPEGRHRSHDAERASAPVEDVGEVKVEVLDFPTAKGLLALLLEAIEEANKRLGEANLPPVIVFLAGGLTELSEEDAKQFDALKLVEALKKEAGAAIQAEVDRANAAYQSNEVLLGELAEAKKELAAAVVELSDERTARRAERETIERLEGEVAKLSQELSLALKTDDPTVGVVGETLELKPDAESPGEKPKKK